MVSIPAKAQARIKDSLKRFQPIVQSAKARDVNESDTVTIITDMLEHVFGYDKYTDITSEHSIRGTYCDLAVKIDGKLEFLIEAKAIGLELKDQHIKQAIDYAANQGVEWVALTNGAEWRIYKVSFTKPINFECVLQFNILNASHKNDADMESLGLLAKEAWKKAQIEQHHSVQQIVNRFTIGAILLTEPVLSAVRRELRRISSDIKVSEEEIRTLIQNEVIKREILEGEKATTAQKQISKAKKETLRKRNKEQSDSNVQDLESFESDESDAEKKIEIG